MTNDTLTPAAEERLRALAARFADRRADLPAPSVYTNCHIHTVYSFSPYTPADAVWQACRAGLATAGIMDHDSVSGAAEFLRAGEITGLPVTVGAECRVRMDGTPLAGRRINNPDQRSVAYVALHGIPHGMLGEVDAFFVPYRAARGERNRAMCARISALTAHSGITLDYERDVLPLSMQHEGGSVTERHLLFALTRRITARCPTPDAALSFLREELGIALPDKLASRIREGSDRPEFYEYDILGALKSALVGKFYIDADAECPDVRDFIALARRVGGIPAYAYLGDVTDSVTGDKRAQRFEDDYLDELMDILKDLGFLAVTYMPSRNTPAQLARVMSLCRRYGFFEISGEDINSPRQSFLCEALAKPECAHLAPAAFALIGHECAATRDPQAGMFSERTLRAMPSLERRIRYFSDLEMKQS